ncbi:hypothetical protein D3C77_345870 [compost metagenome]
MDRGIIVLSRSGLTKICELPLRRQLLPYCHLIRNRTDRRIRWNHINFIGSRRLSVEPRGIERKVRQFLPITVVEHLRNL